MTGAEWPLIGAQFQVVYHYFSSGVAGGTQLIGQDSTRWALLATSTAASAQWITTDPSAPTNSGFNLQASIRELRLIGREVPGLVQSAWYNSGTLTGQITLVEILYRPSG